jgi:hypothetical protein
MTAGYNGWKTIIDRCGLIEIINMGLVRRGRQTMIAGLTPASDRCMLSGEIEVPEIRLIQLMSELLFSPPFTNHSILFQEIQQLVWYPAIYSLREHCFIIISYLDC